MPSVAKRAPSSQPGTEEVSQRTRAQNAQRATTGNTTRPARNGPKTQPSRARKITLPKPPKPIRKGTQKHTYNPNRGTVISSGPHFTPPIPLCDEDSATFYTNTPASTQPPRPTIPVEPLTSVNPLIHADGYGRRVSGLGTPCPHMESSSSLHDQESEFIPSPPSFTHAVYSIVPDSIVPDPLGIALGLSPP